MCFLFIHLSRKHSSQVATIIPFVPALGELAAEEVISKDLESSDKLWP